MIQKIISGGQTGADRAALDAAIKLGITMVAGYRGVAEPKIAHCPRNIK